jgi:hypothetical protein
MLSYSFNHVNALLQVHSEINESPFDALFRVLFLFEYKHVMIEKLLQFLIREINAQLLKSIKLHIVCGWKLLFHKSTEVIYSKTFVLNLST